MYADPEVSYYADPRREYDRDRDLQAPKTPKSSKMKK